MKFISTIILALLCSSYAYSQQWIDTTYQISTTTDIEYGTSTSYAGEEQTHLMDLSVPQGDTPPKCGRPLIVIVHGGAWIAGSKDESTISRLRMDFAKRGYVAVTVNYRLGQFHTEKNVHCNLETWDCLNMTDSSEWYRAYFRAVQDVNGAIRYLVNNADEYNINTSNIFLAGESAGAFTAIGATYIDSDDDVLLQYTKEFPDVAAPNNIYEKPCIQKNNLAESIEMMNLARPHLGSYQGTMNLPTSEYTIRAVAGFYGGVLNNIFPSTKSEVPALYMFHQPNDLIVPIGNGKVFDGLAKCASGFPTFCQNIINRKTLWGTSGMKLMIDSLQLANVTAPQYKIELTNNNADCIAQVADPSKGGHQYDNYWLRTNSAATYFADYVAECSTETGVEESDFENIKVYPNPIDKDGILYIRNTSGLIDIVDIYGKKMYSKALESSSNNPISVQELGLSSGVYMIRISSIGLVHTIKLIVK